MVNHLKARLWITEADDFILNLVYAKTPWKVCEQRNNTIIILRRSF